MKLLLSFISNNKLKAIIALTAIINFSCKHKTDFDKIPEVHYSTDISPIIGSNCTFSGCHGDIAHQKFKLLSYDEVMNYGKVKAKSPETSKLYTVLKTYEDKEIMPAKPYNALTEKQIQLIYVWIGQGAKNN